MKEKNCLNCRNINSAAKDSVPSIGVCLKNYLYIEAPRTHSCDMYEQENREAICANCSFLKSYSMVDTKGVAFEDYCVCKKQDPTVRICYPNIQSCKLFQMR